ncbi:hypothetical protein LJK88_46600 [Paenibacillus sp. P26]|nr:hypothetical protein LJK88_46600 [Paenibacillus sp. P26]UUZ91942.1 hypothetical protein LJK87_41710 [Paenibacillus sp. P25]
MLNVSKTVKMSAVSLAAAAILSIPLSAQAAVVPNPKVKDGTFTEPNYRGLPIPIILGELGRADLINGTPVSTETMDLPPAVKKMVKSVKVISSVGKPSDFLVEIVDDGTRIRFTTTTLARYAEAKVYVYTWDNKIGYYTVTSESLF